MRMSFTTDELGAPSGSDFVASLRGAAPYLHAFRGRTFVVVFPGEGVADGSFASLAHDIAFLSGLGVRLVLVHGARPQIAEQMQRRGVAPRFAGDWRITDAAALEAVKEAAGRMRLEIEAGLASGLARSPQIGGGLRVVGGDFVRARPVGVREGVDFQYTGEVRSVAGGRIRRCLDAGEMVLLSPLGYSATGELFNVAAEEVAAGVAAALPADKLLFLMEGADPKTGAAGLPGQLTLAQARSAADEGTQSPEVDRHLRTAVAACDAGVPRVHLVGREREGALLQELFTRDGVGTLVAADRYEDTRTATPDDIPGILALIAPLEEEGVLVRRGRERLESEVDRFWVMERDGAVIATAALYPFPDDGLGELACVAVHADYRGQGRGDALLREAEERARAQGLTRLLVLTTRAEHWFRERGFEEVGREALPAERQALYNLARQSKVLIKELV